MLNKLITIINNKKFRLNTKKLFLTYSQVHPEITKEYVLEQLQTKLEIKHYIIAREYHKDQGVHMHALLELIQRYDIRNARFLDLIYKNQVIHGNYQAAKNMNALRMYLTKDRDFITNWDINYKTGKLLTLEKKLAIMTTRFGANRTLDYYIHNYPEELDKFSRIESNLKRLNKHLQHKHKEQALYPIDSFEPYKEIDQALLDKTCTTWISGPSGTHKTSYVEARVEANRENGDIQDYMLIRHLDQLKQFNPDKHNLIILDDCKLPSNREDMISIIDIERKGAVNVKHDVITIPANVKRVIISNKTLHEVLSKWKLHKDKALLRRIKEIHVNTAIKIKMKDLILV